MPTVPFSHLLLLERPSCNPLTPTHLCTHLLFRSAYHFSHPPLPERLQAIDAALKKADGESKKTQ